MKTDTADKNPRKFHELLGDLDDGGVVDKIDEDLATLVRQTLKVARSRGPAGTAAGSLSVKLKFKADASGEVAIHVDHSTTAPKIPSALTRRWIDQRSGTIVDSNPRQTELPLREVPGNVSDIRSV